MVELDNGMRFITNFRYNIKPEISKDPAHEERLDKIEYIQSLATDRVEDFESKCD